MSQGKSNRPTVKEIHHVELPVDDYGSTGTKEASDCHGLTLRGLLALEKRAGCLDKENRRLLTCMKTYQIKLSSFFDSSNNQLKAVDSTCIHVLVVDFDVLKRTRLFLYELLHSPLKTKGPAVCLKYVS